MGLTWGLLTSDEGNGAIMVNVHEMFVTALNQRGLCACATIRTIADLGRDTTSLSCTRHPDMTRLVTVPCTVISNCMGHVK